jgi:hypothetical protein
MNWRDTAVATYAFNMKESERIEELYIMNGAKNRGTIKNVLCTIPPK